MTDGGQTGSCKHEALKTSQHHAGDSEVEPGLQTVDDNVFEVPQECAPLVFVGENCNMKHVYVPCQHSSNEKRNGANQDW